MLIPASVMCTNFASLKFVPISPPPQVLMTGAQRSKPFIYCQNKDHVACFRNAAKGEVLFAHSIEELVVWTVEKHYSKYAIAPLDE